MRTDIFFTRTTKPICNFANSGTWGRRRRYPMVVGFSTTYAITAYQHWCWEFEYRSGRGVQHYVIKFVSDLRQVGGPVSSTSKTDNHDITEILLKEALNTIKQTNKHNLCMLCTACF